MIFKVKYIMMNFAINEVVDIKVRFDYSKRRGIIG